MGRTEKSVKNIAFGFGSQGVKTLLTFISRTIMVSILGLEIISLNGLFTEVVAALSLAELGIGSAIVYNLYKPLADKDEEKVCQLMTFFKQAYQMIALAMLVLGTIVCFFVPWIVKDLSFSNSYMRAVFMLFVVGTASSYLFSYKISLLNADQNRYIYSFYSSILQIAQVIILMLMLVTSKNYIVYLIVNIALGLLSNYIISRQVDKHYPYLRKAELPKEDKKGIFDNVKNIFIKELSGKITSSTDNMLISILVSTILVGKYSFYATILAVFKQLTEQIETGIKASMGNLFANGSNEDCERVMYRLTWGYGAMGTFFCVCFFACCQPFISFWVGSKYLLEVYVVLVLTVNLFCYIISKPIYSAMHVSGFFVEGRNISIIGSVVNLIVSIILGYFSGILGIFLGTFCTYFIQILMKTYYVYKLRFHKSGWKYGLFMGQFAIVMFVLMGICYGINQFINTSHYVVDFLIQGGIAAVLSVVTLWILYHGRDEYKYFKQLVIGYMKKKKG